MSWQENIIAIDGPAGAGKSTVAQILARRLNYEYLDSGAIYRAITYHLLKKDNIDVTSPSEVISALPEIEIKVKNGRYFVNGEDVTPYLRQKDVTFYVPKVSRIPEVREKLLSIQRKLAQENNIVIDGRDIGSVVFPKAAYKFFVTATIEERARRRARELGPDVDLEQIKKEIAQRDEEDKNRPISPLVVPDDAIYIDTTKLSIEEVVQKIEYFIQFYKWVKGRKHFFYKLVYYTFKPIFKLFWGLKIENQEVISGLTPPFLIAPNHLSNLDPLLVGFISSEPVIYFLAKKELFESPIGAFIYGKLLTAIPVKRGTIDTNAINHIIMVMKAGHAIAIFPEGTRSRTGKLQQGRAGFGLIARKLKLPIVPVRIRGSEKALPPGAVLPVFTKIRLTVGQPIPYEKYAAIPDTKEGYKQISEMVMKELWKL